MDGTTTGPHEVTSTSVTSGDDATSTSTGASTTGYDGPSELCLSLGDRAAECANDPSDIESDRQDVVESCVALTTCVQVLGASCEAAVIDLAECALRSDCSDIDALRQGQPPPSCLLQNVVAGAACGTELVECAPPSGDGSGSGGESGSTSETGGSSGSEGGVSSSGGSGSSGSSDG